MSKTFMPDLPPDQRLRVLQDSCDSQEQITYYRDLTENDLDINRELLTDNLLAMADHEDELLLAKAKFKMAAKPLYEERIKLLLEVKTRKSMVTGTVFNLANHEAGIMESYDEFGEFISSRRLRPDERQANIFSLAKNS